MDAKDEEWRTGGAEASDHHVILGVGERACGATRAVLNAPAFAARRRILVGNGPDDLLLHNRPLYVGGAADELLDERIPWAAFGEWCSRRLADARQNADGARQNVVLVLWGPPREWEASDDALSVVQNARHLGCSVVQTLDPNDVAVDENDTLRHIRSADVTLVDTHAPHVVPAVRAIFGELADLEERDFATLERAHGARAWIASVRRDRHAHPRIAPDIP